MFENKENREIYTPKRKSDHIRINIEEDTSSEIKNGLDQFQFQHQALPELDLKEIDLHQEIFGKTVTFPLLISSMTGGSEQAWKINQNLATAAQAHGIALGVGSQRAAIEDESLAYSYQVRKLAPDILLFANLGAIQLNYGYSIDHCRKAVDMIQADALILHLNCLQEALQPEGETCFKGLVDKIAKICTQLPVPVIAKEVGWGISEQAAKLLEKAGVCAIDVAGAGGTSWAKVEMHRSRSDLDAGVASAFFNWGITTVESILNVSRAAPEMTIIASGGIRHGVDIAKCIALGASLVGVAGRFLKAANHSPEATSDLCQELRKQISICMFSAGVSDISQLKQTRLIRLQV